ncbi:MAG: histidine kinase [Labilibaculum sp.]|nr:histidine kinase [Labilibaculum sp.]
MHYKFSLKYKQNLSFLVIGVLTIFAFLFLSNLFLEGIQDFETFYTILFILFLWGGCALISYVLNKKYTWQKHTFIHLLWHSTLILALTALAILFFEIIPKTINNEIILYNEIRLDALVIILICFAVSAIGETKDIIMVWKETVVRTNQLEKENIQAQFSALKSQINPHFLFNSLNTLATYVQDLPEVNLYVKNLSEYLRYTLTVKEDLVISINEELNIVNKYIFLQKARFKNNLQIDINIPQELKQSGFIPPFCIQMLVENTIKHNIISQSKPLHVKIYYRNNNYLIVENNLQVKETQSSTKVGLKNIEERYRLISDKRIIVEKTEDVFRVTVPVIDNMKH